MSNLIEDYALIGDCHSGALVSRCGSIDWFCAPRFDSAACFAALLGTPDNGRWLLCPQGEVASVKRRYQDETLILETVFETAEGEVAVIDFMPPRNDVADIVRIVEGRRGRVDMHMELCIRLDNGQVVPWVRRRERGVRAVAGPDAFFLTTGAETHGKDWKTIADFTIAEGQRETFVLTWCPSYRDPPQPLDPFDALAGATSFWHDWAQRCVHQGRWREAIVRSLITLKALTYAPTGGIIAALTTSLPEEIGGERNWDYRFCWLRDATFTLFALVDAGYHEEAKAWSDWLVRAVAGKPNNIQPLYGILGERRLTEFEVPWLAGYEGSLPVRIGNQAAQQLQIDVFGEVMDTLHTARKKGVSLDEDAWRVQQRLIDYLLDAWHKPDAGIWEVRGDPQHFTHSKVMAWVALERAIADAKKFQLPGDLDTWRRVRQQIHEEVCLRGFDREMNSFTQAYGSKHLDASLLMLPLVGFLPAHDPRMRGTVAAIEDSLMHDGFVRRYNTSSGVDGLSGEEGALLMCSFWLADNYALMDRRDEANELFERLLSLRNDVGLYAEEYDPRRRRFVGNFPQAFSHVSLVNTAKNLEAPRHDGGPSHERGEK
ncbi:MAG: glycoside hydrolase family 15 protein [Pirellulaceae bacterium]|nr:glycoside hydrolase family 15 protein [Planctomycetales bacterium]MCA9203422.1 glycoside hydrolase family 15 protein [Planctomycetales bacterium]MCA9223120.1 glycoside hydrolase family 15 protein [Planctomycetales bacterium]